MGAVHCFCHEHTNGFFVTKHYLFLQITNNLATFGFDFGTLDEIIKIILYVVSKILLLNEVNRVISKNCGKENSI